MATTLPYHTKIYMKIKCEINYQKYNSVGGAFGVNTDTHEAMLIPMHSANTQTLCSIIL